MRSRITAIALALVLGACAAKDNGETFVRDLYAPYAEATPSAPDLFSRDVYTPELKAVLERARTYSAILDEPVIDADPFIWGQDGTPENLVVTAAAPAKDGQAAVAAKFELLGARRDVRFALRQTESGWRIDDISSSGESLRQIIEKALAPVAAPAELEAPVRAVYARYGTPGAYVPLQNLTALTPSLRQRLTQAIAQGAPGIADFDPAADAKRPAIGPVAFETASACVIVRFDSNGTQKLLAYDLVEQDGAWRIADIRSPGQWSLTEKLSAAGFPATP